MQIQINKENRSDRLQPKCRIAEDFVGTFGRKKIEEMKNIKR